MHICFITHEYPSNGRTPGGIGIFVKTLGTALAAAGHRVSVIGGVSSPPPFHYHDGPIAVYESRPPRLPLLKWWERNRQLYTLIKKIDAAHPIDILEGAENAFAYLPKLPHIQKVIRLHGGHCFFASTTHTPFNWRKKLHEKRSFHNCNAVIGITEFAWKQTNALLKIDHHRHEIIQHPIDLNLFSPMPEITELPLHLTFAGTLCKKKGLYELCQAIALLQPEFPTITLNIIGRDGRTEAGTSYKEYIQNTFFPTLHNNIVFHGALSHTELKRYYAQAQLCIFPSHMETQGLVAPEAMAMKKLVIFSSAGPGPETIEHRKTGLLCDPHDPTDIASHIKWALTNPREVEEIKNNAYHFVHTKFDSELVVKKNIAFYEKLLQ
jgi:glycosyltransferase involved in cell wall biosynthesis